MKSTLIFLLTSLICLPAFADAEMEIASADVYQAIEELAVYIEKKDPSFQASQVYRDILEHSSEVGLERGLIFPAEEFLQFESAPVERAKLKKILGMMPSNNPNEVDTTSRGPKPRRIDIVANSYNECVGQCIRDVLGGAASGATIGASLGGAAGAAGGGIIGGSLGGVACSTSPQCNGDKDKDSDKKIVRPRDIDQATQGSIQEKFKSKRIPSVNPGLVGVRGW